MEVTDITCLANNLLHSLFEECNFSINGVAITLAADLYCYRVYRELLLTYGNEAAESLLTNAFWYRDTGELGVCVSSATVTAPTDTGFVVLCDRLRQSKEIEMVGRLHTDIQGVSL